MTRVAPPPKPPREAYPDEPPRLPPPPPVTTRSPTEPPPRPSRPPLTEHEREELTLRALGLLREQVEARIVHYKAELETSPELDAVTAQVVQQIKQLQEAAAKERPVERDPELIENAHIGMLHRLVNDVLVADMSYPTRAIQPIGKRLAKLFFASELHVEAQGQRDKVIHLPEQGVYYVLKRYRNRLRTELDGFEYVSPELRASTEELLAKIERDLQVAFLSRRSPELNRVMGTFTGVLIDFFQKHLPPRLEQMARLTVRTSKTARQANSVPYKIHTDRFAAFRASWERVLMTQMIHFCGDEFISRLDEGSDEVRQETISFFTDPQIYSVTCEVICEGLYDRLCVEGFLDLPVDWRVSLSQAR